MSLKLVFIIRCSAQHVGVFKGEVSEWSKEHDWKSCMLRKGHRGFESLSLHQSTPIHLAVDTGYVWLRRSLRMIRRRLPGVALYNEANEFLRRKRSLGLI